MTCVTSIFCICICICISGAHGGRPKQRGGRADARSSGVAPRGSDISDTGCAVVGTEPLALPSWALGTEQLALQRKSSVSVEGIAVGALDTQADERAAHVAGDAERETAGEPRAATVPHSAGAKTGARVEVPHPRRVYVSDHFGLLATWSIDWLPGRA